MAEFGPIQLRSPASLHRLLPGSSPLPEDVLLQPIVSQHGAIKEKKVQKQYRVKVKNGVDQLELAR
jgi:hypothetical protein